jgi:hypothetical protein
MARGTKQSLGSTVTCCACNCRKVIPQTEFAVARELFCLTRKLRGETRRYSFSTDSQGTVIFQYFSYRSLGKCWARNVLESLSLGCWFVFVCECYWPSGTRWSRSMFVRILTRSSLSSHVRSAMEYTATAVCIVIESE